MSAPARSSASDSGSSAQTGCSDPADRATTMAGCFDVCPRRQPLDQIDWQQRQVDRDGDQMRRALRQHCRPAQASENTSQRPREVLVGIGDQWTAEGRIARLLAIDVDGDSDDLRRQPREHMGDHRPASQRHQRLVDSTHPPRSPTSQHDTGNPLKSAQSEHRSGPARRGPPPAHRSRRWSLPGDRRAARSRRCRPTLPRHGRHRHRDRRGNRECRPRQSTRNRSSRSFRQIPVHDRGGSARPTARRR